MKTESREDAKAAKEKRKKARRKSDELISHIGITELERLLQDEEATPIQILPNGEIRRADGRQSEKGLKPLTLRENLGGEYAA